MSSMKAGGLFAKLLCLLLLWCGMATAACARVGFESAGAGDRAATDGSRSDGSVADQQGGEKKADGGTRGWVTIPAGSFMMGSPTTEPCRYDDEVLHSVTLTHPYEIQATEVTQAEFKAQMGYNPSFRSACGATCPVESISWHEAAAYCNKLSAQHGLALCYTCTGTAANVKCSEAAAYGAQQVYLCPGYRLPTEAEWERAYRATTMTAFYNGANTAGACKCPAEDAVMNQIGWYCANAGSTTHPVGQKQANTWGLYDMAGNVWEWCHDWLPPSGSAAAATDPWGVASSSYRVFRGGGWSDGAQETRAASRGTTLRPTSRDDVTGVRCARTLAL